MAATVRLTSLAEEDLRPLLAERSVIDENTAVEVLGVIATDGERVELVVTHHLLAVAALRMLLPIAGRTDVFDVSTWDQVLALTYEDRERQIELLAVDGLTDYQAALEDTEAPDAPLNRRPAPPAWREWVTTLAGRDGVNNRTIDRQATPPEWLLHLALLHQKQGLRVLGRDVVGQSCTFPLSELQDQLARLETA